MNLVDIINKESQLLPPEINILIVDDCIYTGQHTIGTIDDFTSNLVLKKYPSYKEPYDIPNFRSEQENIIKKINFHFVIPYVSQYGRKSIQDAFGIVNSFYPRSVLRSLNWNEIVNTYDEGKIGIFVMKFQIENMDVPAIYFDHKVADSFSTFSTIYLQGIIPPNDYYGSLFRENPSRYKIEELSKFLSQ